MADLKKLEARFSKVGKGGGRSRKVADASPGRRSDFKGERARANLRMSPELKAALENEAKRAGLSFNEFCVSLLAAGRIEKG